MIPHPKFNHTVKLERSTQEDAISLLKKARSAKDLAKILEVPVGQLLYIIYKRSSQDNYLEFQISKKTGGERTISAPRTGLAILQQKVKFIFEGMYTPPEWVHGFVSDKSILTNAKNHTKQRYVLNIDLEDFFGQVNFGRVRGMLMSKHYQISEKVATILAQIVTSEDKLPQGACTSPLFSNMVAWTLDKKMISLSKRFHLKYSRYADDLTLSTSKSSFSSKIISWDGDSPVHGELIIGDSLSRAIQTSGFRINEKKLRLQIPSIRQEVTGLTVNQFVNVKRKYVRNVRALLNSWEQRGLLEAEEFHIKNHSSKQPDVKNGSYYRQVVYGHLAHLKSIRGQDDSLYIKLCMKLASLDPDPPKFIQEAKERFEMYDFFICHASEDKDEVARPISEELTAAGKTVFFDEKDIAWGDSFVHKINNALAKSKFVIAVLSKNSIKKKWPLKEINAVLSQQIASGEKKFLPLAVCDEECKFEKILEEFPLISDLHFLEWESDAQLIKDKALSLLS